MNDKQFKELMEKLHEIDKGGNAIITLLLCIIAILIFL